MPSDQSGDIQSLVQYLKELKLANAAEALEDFMKKSVA